MQSIILELQEIISKSSSVSDLLLKGLVISQKLKLIELQKWVKSELCGYRENQKLPEYRYVYGEIAAFDHIQVD